MLAFKTGRIESALYYKPIVFIGIATSLLYWLVSRGKELLYLKSHAANNSGISVQGLTTNFLNSIGELSLYYGSIIALFGLYFYLLKLCSRSRLDDRRTMALTLLFPVIFNIGLLFVRPYFSIDMFSYLGQGYLGITPGSNPYINGVKEVADTPFGRQLLAWGWRPVHGISPYGPLWTHLSMVVVRIAQNIPTEIFLLKSIVVTAHLLSAALIWQILARVRPQVQLLGTVGYLWNPLVTIECAAEGHNDALAIVFTLLALLLTIEARPATSIFSLVLGILVKYIPIIFLPSQVAYYWHSDRPTGKMSQTWLQILLGLILGIGVAVLLYWQLWVGADTFQGLTQQASIPGTISAASLLSQFLKFLPLGLPVRQLAAFILKGIFCIIVLLVTIKVNSKTRLLKSCGTIALAYVLLIPTVYWPWYASLPIALMALSPMRAFQLVSFGLSFGSCLLAPIDLIRRGGLLP
jgi:alpha-1,6-mannosyltransferase